MRDGDCPRLKAGREAWVVRGAGVEMEGRETEEALPWVMPRLAARGGLEAGGGLRYKGGNNPAVSHTAEGPRCLS